MDLRSTNQRVITQFRAGGDIDGMHRERLLLLTTTGRKSGTPRVCPLMFHREGGRLLVIASMMGAPAHPDWYLNLLADPQTTVEIGSEQYPATAIPLGPEDRDRVWKKLTQDYPFLADHQAKTTRTIPVVELRPLQRPAAS